MYQLSKAFKLEYPAIPWSMVSGLRHRLVHDYDGINWSFIVDVIFDDMDPDDMDPFVQEIQTILQNINLILAVEANRVQYSGVQHRRSGSGVGNSWLRSMVSAAAPWSICAPPFPFDSETSNGWFYGTIRLLILFQFLKVDFHHQGIAHAELT